MRLTAIYMTSDLFLAYSGVVVAGTLPGTLADQQAQVKDHSPDSEATSNDDDEDDLPYPQGTSRSKTLPSKAERQPSFGAFSATRVSPVGPHFVDVHVARIFSS